MPQQVASWKNEDKPRKTRTSNEDVLVQAIFRGRRFYADEVLVDSKTFRMMGRKPLLLSSLERRHQGDWHTDKSDEPYLLLACYRF